MRKNTETEKMLLNGITDLFNSFAFDYSKAQDDKDTEALARITYDLLTFERILKMTSDTIQKNPLVLHLESQFGRDIDEIFEKNEGHKLIRTVDKKEYADLKSKESKN